MIAKLDRQETRKDEKMKKEMKKKPNPITPNQQIE